MGRKPPLTLRVAEYCPDMPNYMSGQSDNMLNVIPRTRTSYGPLSSPAAFSTALGARCLGAYFGLDSAGNVNGFAGDTTKLYRLAAGSNGWDDVSKGGGYSIGTDSQWKFMLFGQRVIALNIGSVPQSYILGTSTDFADLITTSNPPSARYGAVIKSFLMLANTTDAIYGEQPQRAWWSRNGNPTNFDAPGSAIAQQFQTSFQDLLGEGGWIQGIVGNLGTADGAIFMEHAIFRVVWVGGQAVFDFFPAQGVRGTPAPGSIAQLGALVYYLGEDGFYVFDGSNSRPIGNDKVDKTFYADLDQQYFSSISSAIDPINKLYIIAYPGQGHTGANCSKMLIYNWALDRWSPALPLPDGFEIIVRGLSFGYTLDELYTILGYTLDNLPFPLDSRVWTGGNLLLALFDTNHKLNFFTGNNLDATVDTAEVQQTPGGSTKINMARPIIDGSNTTIGVALAVRNRQSDNVNPTSFSLVNSLGLCPQRAAGRYVRARIFVPGMQDWTHLSGVELEGAPDGARY